METWAFGSRYLEDNRRELRGLHLSCVMLARDADDSLWEAIDTNVHRRSARRRCCSLACQIPSTP